MRSFITMSVCCTVAAVLSPRVVSGFSLFGRPRSKTVCASFAVNAKQCFSTTLYASTAEVSSVEDNTATNQKKIPVTLLSGFLGSGKTTALKHLLENKAGIKVGVVVNDVASVNIDAKLISGGSESDGAIELQNGCACCSLADELLVSLDTLLENQMAKNDSFDAVIVELSGVADPLSVKQNWQDAVVSQHPATMKASVDRVVTVVDASTFGTDWFSWNVAGERRGWVVPGDECAATRKVAELLAEQVEAADTIIVNKIDLAGEEQTKVAMEVAKGINSQSKSRLRDGPSELFTSSWGKVPLEGFLGLEVGKKASVDSMKSVVEQKKLCKEPGCTDTSHSHEHGDHATFDEPGCTDTSHSHSHDHGEHSCAEPACTDASHSHSHDHAASECSDPSCDDPTHDHSHSHNHSSSKATIELGISSFVYKSSRPFNSNKLMALLNKWPVPLKEELDIELMKEAATDGYEVAEKGMDSGSPFAGVLRSKGFCWLAPTNWSRDPWRHDTAMYWSHAGKHFGIQTAGKWWGSMTKEQMERFGSINPKEFERITREDFVSEEWGDRRQELVFIGVELNEEEVTNALNDCLMSDEEMEMYRVQVQNLLNASMSKESGAGGPSLMDVGGVDHIDAP